MSNPRTTPRPAALIALDRQAIVDYVRDATRPGSTVRPAAWMRPGDIAALVKAGQLVREVRQEWDPQPGYAGRSGLFGGAGVCKRLRAYLGLPSERCPGSDHWAPGTDVLGKGRCDHCGQLVRCNASGILFGHDRWT